MKVNWIIEDYKIIENALHTYHYERENYIEAHKIRLELINIKKLQKKVNYLL